MAALASCLLTYILRQIIITVNRRVARISFREGENVDDVEGVDEGRGVPSPVKMNFSMEMLHFHTPWNNFKSI